MAVNWGLSTKTPKQIRLKIIDFWETVIWFRWTKIWEFRTNKPMYPRKIWMHCMNFHVTLIVEDIQWMKFQNLRENESHVGSMALLSSVCICSLSFDDMFSKQKTFFISQENEKNWRKIAWHKEREKRIGKKIWQLFPSFRKAF